MRSVSVRLWVVAFLVVLAAGPAASLLQAQTGCWRCEEYGFLCGFWMDCSYVCELVGHEEQGDGIICQQWFTLDGLSHCAVYGGACFNIVVEGEGPDCQDYCPG